MAKKKKKVAKKKKAAPAAKKAAFGMQPLFDRVLIKPQPAETRTPSGIIIPDTAKQEKASMGVVVAVGPGNRGDDNELVPMTVAPGDTVLFNAGWDNEIDYKGEKYFLVHESDVKAIIN